MLKIGLTQSKVSENPEENLAKTARFIKQAARRGAEIVCLQELFAYRYFARTKSERFFEFAESVPGRLSEFLLECAAVNRILLIGGSVYERGAEGKLYNRSLVYDFCGRLAA